MLAPRSPLLLANRPAEKYPTIAFDNLTQQRRFFDPRVIYQDADALLVAVAPTAKPNSPHQVQRLDVATGRGLWSHPASPYYFQKAAHPPRWLCPRLPQRPRTGLRARLADDGRELGDFQRKLME